MQTSAEKCLGETPLKTSAQTEKLNVATSLILGTLFLQVILSAGLLLRVNQVYREIMRGVAEADILDITRVEGVSADDDPFRGSQDAPVTIVEFSDFSCGHCRTMQETLSQVMDRYEGLVRIVYRDFPLETGGTPSFTAALAAECADDQGKFWEMHDVLFVNQSALDKGSVQSYAASIGLDLTLFRDCLNSQQHRDEILQDFADGRAYGVGSTPTVFVNGRRLVGAVQFSVLRDVIEEALKQ